MSIFTGGSKHRAKYPVEAGPIESGMGKKNNLRMGKIKW